MHTAPTADEEHQSFCRGDQGIDLNIFVGGVSIAAARPPEYCRNRKCLVKNEHVAGPLNADDWRLSAQHRFRALR